MINAKCNACGNTFKLYVKTVKPGDEEFYCRNCSYGTQKVPFKYRLQVKVNMVLIPLIIFIMGAFSAFNYFTIKNDMETELKNTSNIVATKLSKYLIEAFWSIDDAILSESLKSEMMDKRVFAINILDWDRKKIHMGYKRDPNWAIVENNDAIQINTINASKMIIKGKEQIGSVEVHLTSKYIKDELKKSMLNIGITSLILAIAVSIAANFILQRIIVNPIIKITGIANKISLGDNKTKILKESKDEIGILSEAFERMRISVAYAINKFDNNSKH